MTNEYCRKCGAQWDSDYQSHTCPPTDLKADLQRLDAAYRSWCQNCTTDNLFRLANASRESQLAAVLQRLEELEADLESARASGDNLCKSIDLLSKTVDRDKARIAELEAENQQLRKQFSGNKYIEVSPYRIVPIPCGKDGKGPETDPEKVETVVWEVWDRNQETVAVLPEVSTVVE